MAPQLWRKRHGAVTDWSSFCASPWLQRAMLFGDLNMTKMTKRGVDSLQDCSRRSIWLLVGRRIRARRTQRGHPVQCVAEELGVSLAAYASYESGETEVPAFLLAQLAEYLGVPVAWFFQDATLSEKKGNHVCRVSAPAYRVTTVEQRIDALADSFRKLDLEGQQHLLAVAAALSRTNAKEGQK
jgi:transcriptional regulator with XRE-family HTH domain